MIELFAWPTPNGLKITIALEELGLPYRVTDVNINMGDQHSANFLKISPNNKIPAIIDLDGPDGRPVSIFESGAILLYLAQKTGRLLPLDRREEIACLEWLFFQVGGFGPGLGQAKHYRSQAPEKLTYPIEMTGREAARLFGVLNKRLGAGEYAAGRSYSIADIALYPWCRAPEAYGVRAGDYPHVQRWMALLEQRGGVQRGLVAYESDEPQGLDRALHRVGQGVLLKPN